MNPYCTIAVQAFRGKHSEIPSAGKEPSSLLIPQWSLIWLFSLFFSSLIHTLNKKKNTAPWYRSNTAVALFLRQIFAMRATLFEQLQVYCLHMYKHALFRWFNLIRHFHDITIFYFLFFFFGVLFPSFSFLTPMRGKFILLARNSCPCTLQEEVNSILASCFFWIYVVIMKEKWDDHKRWHLF